MITPILLYIASLIFIGVVSYNAETETSDRVLCFGAFAFPVSIIFGLVFFLVSQNP